MDISSAPNPTPLEVTAAATKEERLWAMGAHLSTFAGHLIPLGNIAGPLIVWALKKDEMPLVNDQGKEALNFQITMSLAMILAGLSIFVLIGFVLLPLVYLFDVIMTVIAAIKANEGTAYRYPLTLRLVK